jgi:hypothetical protein
MHTCACTTTLLASSPTWFMLRFLQACIRQSATVVMSPLKGT